MSVSAASLQAQPVRFSHCSQQAGALSASVYTTDAISLQFTGSPFPGRQAGLTLRTGHLKDTREILAFFYRIEKQDYNHTYTEVQQQHLKTHVENLLRASQNNAASHVYVARNPAGKIVALATLEQDPQTPDVAALGMNYLDKQYRGLGIGKWMIEQRLKRARQHGIKTVRTDARMVSVYLLAEYGFEIDRKGIEGYRAMTKDHPLFKDRMPYSIPLKLDLTA